MYFSRPLERVDYVFAKYAAMTSALFLLTALPLTVMLVGALIVGLPLADQIPDYLRAMAGAALISLLLAGIGLVIAAITPRRGLAVAAIIAVLLVLVAVQGILEELAAAEGFDLPYLGLLSPFSLAQGIQTYVLGSTSQMPSPPGAIGAAVFCFVAALIIAGSFGILLLRYRRVSAS